MVNLGVTRIGSSMFKIIKYCKSFDICQPKGIALILIIPYNYQVKVYQLSNPLTVENMNPRASIGFYDFNAKALQGKTQCSTTYSFEVEYPEIKSDIPPRIEENGVIF